MIQVVEQISDALRQEVSAYLADAPATGAATVGEACGEMDPRWLSILRDGLNHRPHALIAREGDASSAPGNIVGYLPVAFVGSRLFGRFLVSLPYLNRAGVLANDASTAEALIDRAASLAADLDAQYLELRHGQPTVHAKLDKTREDKVRMVLKLPGATPAPTEAPADAPPQKKKKQKGVAENEPFPAQGQPGAEWIWKSVDAKVRNLVRKGEKSELTLVWGSEDVLDEFYNVFAVNMRDLGTPVYGRSLFASILQQLGKDAELAVVRHKGRAIAGALLVHTPALRGGTVPSSTQVPSASALREYNSTNANMWMYYHLQLRAIARGSAEFDFGRSSVDSGTYKFKSQWNAQPVPTVWQYHLRRGEVNAVRPDSPKYRRRIETWQKLPVWLTRLVGPSIVRGIP